MTMTQRQEAVAAIEMLEDEDVRSVIDYVEFLAQRHQRNAEKNDAKKWELFERGRKSFTDDFFELFGAGKDLKLEIPEDIPISLETPKEAM